MTPRYQERVTAVTLRHGTVEVAYHYPEAPHDPELTQCLSQTNWFNPWLDIRRFRASVNDHQWVVERVHQYMTQVRRREERAGGVHSRPRVRVEPPEQFRRVLLEPPVMEPAQPFDLRGTINVLSGIARRARREEPTNIQDAEHYARLTAEEERQRMLAEQRRAHQDLVNERRANRPTRHFWDIPFTTPQWLNTPTAQQAFYDPPVIDATFNAIIDPTPTPPGDDGDGEDARVP